MTTPGWYPCPYLNRMVELTGERLEHIAEAHPTFLKALENLIAEVLA